ncbi:MAG: exosortase system-associated protein, TIGR04073 family [Candidatus Sumerlaeia bacterium]
MTKVFGILAMILVLMVLGMSMPAAQAADDYRPESDIDNMFTKLGRGLVNVFTGWLEIPSQIGKTIRKTDPVTGTVIGLLKGSAWTVARMCTGVYEVVTFPFPLPENYEPIIEPEYIVKSMWGEPMPVFGDPNNNAWEGMDSPGTPPYR